MAMDSPGRTGAWATAGAVASAVASSACCWLPLLLLTFGASAFGVATFFEKYRPVFLAVAITLLGTGFYFNYFRKERCAPGSACAAPRPGLRRLNRTMLWVAAVFVAAFSLFPSYVGALLGAPAPPAAGSGATNPIVLTFAVEGMTCSGCAVNTQKALAGVPGVLRAETSFEDKSALVELDPTQPPDTRALLDAIEGVGYRATVRSE